MRAGADLGRPLDGAVGLLEPCMFMSNQALLSIYNIYTECTLHCTVQDLYRMNCLELKNVLETLHLLLFFNLRSRDKRGFA